MRRQPVDVRAHRLLAPGQQAAAHILDALSPMLLQKGHDATEHAAHLTSGGMAILPFTRPDADFLGDHVAEDFDVSCHGIDADFGQMDVISGGGEGGEPRTATPGPYRPTPCRPPAPSRYV